MKKYLFVLILFGLFITDTIPQENNTYLKNRIMIDFIYKRNISPFGEVWSNGIGGYAGYGFAFQDHYLIILRTGYIDHIVSDNFKDSTEFKNASSVVIPFHIGGRYYFNDDMFMPFVTFVNGLNVVFENTDLAGNKKKRTLVKYAWTVGGGLTYNITNNISLEIVINYNSHFYTTHSMMTGFEYNFGVGIGLY